MKMLGTKLMLGAMSLATTLAWAGPSSGGGGMVVTCQNNLGGIISTELLDLYEAMQDPKRKVMQASGSLPEDYLRLVDRTYSLQGAPDIAESMREEILENLKKFLGSIDFVDDLQFLGDQGQLTIELPQNCKLEQLAIFYDSTQRVSVNKNIWVRLDSMSRAALVQHELFYHFERQFNETTSESTRSYVRQITSATGDEPVLSGSENASGLGYASEDKGKNISMFYIHKTQNKLGLEDLTLQFTHIAGRPLLVKTTVSLPNFILGAECRVDGLKNERYCYPNISASKQVRIPLNTTHRDDWEVLLSYVSGKPISITLIQRGVPISTGFINSL